VIIPVIRTSHQGITCVPGVISIEGVIVSVMITSNLTKRNPLNNSFVENHSLFTKTENPGF
jgi:hypothetical protein